MLGAFSDYGNVWVEITRSDHGHGGPGWNFGACLWSPSRNKAGSDRYGLMREPSPGDLVLHFYHHDWPDGVSDNRLCGRSIVARGYREVQTEPPSPGNWTGMAPYYRIDLKDYQPFPNPLPFSTLKEVYGDEIRREIVQIRPRSYPFNTYGDTIRTVQGIYLARCTPDLYVVLRQALRLEEAATAGQTSVGAPLEPSGELNPHEEYAEGRRAAHERYFFARNRSLVRRAKEYYGYTCQACSFNFADKYGELGAGYIECHHLNPLSERSEEEWTEGIRTRLDEVTVLCSNCHRMIHRQKPTLSLVQLKSMIASTGG
jgi:hypothetical protein